MATPLVASLAFRKTVTFEMYQPFVPDRPDRAAVELGAVVSTSRVIE